MNNKWIKVGFLIALAAAWSVLLTCSKKEALPTESPDPAITIEVTPFHGAPGSPIEITGYTFDLADTTITLLVGNQPTVFISDSVAIKALIPLFLDSGSTWPLVPAGPQDIVILRGGDTVALAKRALAIDSLPHADGATETIRQDILVIANSLKTIWNSLPQIPGSDERIPGYQYAFMAMLDSIVVGADSSLEAILTGTSSWTNNEVPDMALHDALLASCGALEFYNEFAGSVGQFSQKVAATTQSSIFCRGGGPDMDLACEMQIFVLLDDYRRYFVKPTTQTYAETVGLAAGLVATSGFAKGPILIINALMQVFEFVYGTLAPSLFPAEVTAFTLSLEADTIKVNDHTASTISVTAKNRPSSIKATDILEALIEAAGLAKAPTGIATSFREVLKEAIEWALELYRKAAVSYNSSHGGALFIDPEANLPDMTWGPITVTHSDLVVLFSDAPEIISEDTSVFEWKGLKKGQGNIEARGRTAGERSKVLIDRSLCLLCIYYGGAFGLDVPTTETKTLAVGKLATLDMRITGLPSGTDGSVIVDGPNGYTSGVLTKSDLLRGLEPGDYHITAIEVVDATGHAYVPEPVDQHVMLDEGDSTRVEIHYGAKFGSLLVTVAGLPGGVDADIDLSGPSVFVHIITDTLVDSLLPGTYTVVARDVVDPSTSEVVVADPKSQNVEVIGRQTATCAVTYGNPVTMKLQIGNPYLAIRPSTKYPYTKWSEATYSPSRFSAPTEFVQDHYYDGQNGPGPGPAFGCAGDSLTGGLDSGFVSSSVITSKSGAYGYVSFSPIDGKSMKLQFGGYSDADVGGATDQCAVASLQLNTWSWGILEIENKTTSDKELWCKYVTSGISEGYTPDPGSGILSQVVLNYNLQTSCSALGVLGWSEVPQELRLYINMYNETTNLVGDRFLTSVPPGKSYVQLVTTLVSACGSCSIDGVSTWFRNQFEGTITLELRP